MMKELTEVISYFFPEGSSLETVSQRLFFEGAKLDDEIRDNFADLRESYLKKELNLADYSAQQVFALLLLLDQVPRHIFRGQGKAFSSDLQALELCLEALDKGLDLQLTELERIFFYLPLEHSENNQHQQLSCELYKRLYLQSEGPIQEGFKISWQFAKLHRDIVAEFGRFPQRNKALNRTSTQEELDYLEHSAENFGQ